MLIQSFPLLFDMELRIHCA